MTLYLFVLRGLNREIATTFGLAMTSRVNSATPLEKGNEDTPSSSPSPRRGEGKKRGMDSRLLTSGMTERKFLYYQDVRKEDPMIRGFDKNHFG